ncbi:MAG: adenylyl-sulfate kinase [Thiotrichaceae bacterium]
MKNKKPERSGAVLFFTGLSGSGKSTIASMVYTELLKLKTHPVILLDGDDVRQKRSMKLGFSRKDREKNILNISLQANEVVTNKGIAICALIAPYSNARKEARKLIEKNGVFIEIHISTPLAVCEARDSKGMYAKARRGEIANFTGISDPYEAPSNPDIRIDTSEMTLDMGMQKVLSYLQAKTVLFSLVEA